MVQIRRYAHGEGDFWHRMGPFLASAAVRRELGGPITSDEATEWWIAIDDQSETIGFAAARHRKDVWELRHAYVVSEWRGRGVYHSLCQLRLNAGRETGAKVARTTVNEHSLPVYLELGFREVSSRGRYTVVEKELTVDEPV